MLQKDDYVRYAGEGGLYLWDNECQVRWHNLDASNRADWLLFFDVCREDPTQYTEAIIAAIMNGLCPQKIVACTELTKTGFAGEEGVSPDFLTVAKGLTGGYLPVAATLTTEQVYEAFLGPPEAGRTFFHGHTYTGNALGCAAALASLDLLTGPGGMDAVPAKAERLRSHLQRLWEIPIVGDVRQRGMMAGVELVKDRRTKEPFPASLRLGHKVCLRMRDKGVILRPLGDVVVVMPPLAISEDLLDRIGAALDETLREFAASGWSSQARP